MRKLSGLFKNLSVSWKFVLAYFAILFIPIILMGVYLYNQNSRTAIEQARLVMEQNLLQTKASILQKQKVIENSADMLLSDKFKNFLDSIYASDVYRVEDYQFEFSPNVKNILQQSNIIYSIRIYMSNAITYEMMGSYYSIRSMESPDLYSDMLKHKPLKSGWRGTHFTIPHLLKPMTDVPVKVFSYSRGIYPKGNEQKGGVIDIEIKESIFFDMLRDPVISNMGKVFIVDSENNIDSDNIPELFGRNVLESGFSNYESGKKVSTTGNINGVQSMLISIPIDEINCNIVGVFPVSNFNSEVKKSLGGIILVLVISSIILGFLIYFTTNALLLRMKRLVRAMKQVRDENLDVTVPVKVMDEFGELALSFNHMTGRIHELVEMVYKSRILEREAELKAWEAQINPHFLYNTLATISWVARKGRSQDIVKISNSLAKFYRLVLSKGSSLIYAGEELDMVMAFLQIQKIRFEEKFDVIYCIDENVNNHMVIKHILQPIVENALNHGIEPKMAHGTIILKAWISLKELNFQVIDDGVGMNQAALSDIMSGKVEKSGGSGYAIKNIIERLKAYYGTGYSFDIFSKSGIGTVTTITISIDESIS